MKAITLHQPWASLIAWEDKRFETRSWPTRYRGKIAIHAGQTNALSGIVDETMINPIITRAFRQHGIDWRHLPCGAVLGVANLVECIQMTPELIAGLPQYERLLGDWTEGRWAWRFDAVTRFREPIPARGKQGIWNWVAS